MYFLVHSEQGIYEKLIPRDWPSFSKFDAFNDGVCICIFRTKSDAISFADMLNKKYHLSVSVHPLSELESFLKG